MIDLGELPVGKYMYAEPAHNADFYTARKTPIYDIREKNTCGRLGWLKWYPAWRGFCFFPTVNTVFDAGCLQQIREWIAELDKRHKQRKLQGEKP
jgi:hypothetical protein